MCSTLSWVGSLVDFDCVFWLGLIEVGEGGGGENFSFQSVQLFFRIRGFWANKKIPTKKVVLWPQLGGEGRPLCCGHHPKVPLFFDAAPYQSLYWPSSYSENTRTMDHYLYSLIFPANKCAEEQEPNERTVEQRKDIGSSFLYWYGIFRNSKASIP